jgi:hypothetical protein
MPLHTLTSKEAFRFSIDLTAVACWLPGSLALSSSAILGYSTDFRTGGEQKFQVISSFIFGMFDTDGFFQILIH